MSYVVYDIEIIKGILGRKETKVPGIEYCKGWNDHENMGVSVIGAYDSVEDRYRVFCEDNFDDFFDLCEERDVLVTFNGVKFDNKVLVAALEWNMPDHKDHYDILREIWISQGLNPDKFYWKTHGGFGLDAMCEANGLGKKSGHGAMAPVQWQRGEIGTVIDYCLNDVAMTNSLFLLSQTNLTPVVMVSPKGGTMTLRKVDTTKFERAES